MAVDWASFKNHREQVAKDHGTYVGLLDEHGEPLMDCPPMVVGSAPKTRNIPTSARFQFVTKGQDGLEHPLIPALLGDTATGQWFAADDEGRVVKTALESTRFLIVERPDAPRQAYRFTHATASSGIDSPGLVEAHGFDMLKMLNLIPAFSAPATISGVWTEFTRDWAGPEGQAITFKKPRFLQDMKMMTVADGGTVEGAAETVIRRVVTESVDATMTAINQDDPPIVVDQSGTGLDSPHILIRPTDGPLLDEITPHANDSGVHVDAYLWLPGDAAVNGRTFTKPTIVVTVKQMIGVSDGG